MNSGVVPRVRPVFLLPVLVLSFSVKESGFGEEAIQYKVGFRVHRILPSG